MTLFQINRKMKLSILAVVVEGLLSGCNFFVLFQILGMIFEENVTLRHMYHSTFQLAVIFLFRLVLYIAGYTGSQLGGSDVSRNIRIGIGNKLKKIPLGQFTKKRTGFYINAATSEVSDYEQILTHKLADIVKYSILVLATAIYTGTLYLPIGLLLLLSSALLVPSMYLTIRKIKKIGVQKNLARERNVSGITEYLSGSQTLRAYGLAGKKNVSLTTAMKEYSDISYQYEKAILPIGHSFTLFGMAVAALSVILAVKAWQMGEIEPGVLVLLIMLPLFVSKVNMSLYISLTAYRNLLLSKDKLSRILEEEEEEAFEGEFMPESSQICFRNVSFFYTENEPVLKNVNLVIPEKKLTAIVGDSGTGKSTILNLISRYYKPQGGEITIGGVTINRIPSEQVLEKMSLVDQDVFLFNDSVWNNIRYANPKATEKEIREACRLANCEDFILQMEKGYDAVVGENGNKLSGGERQRLSVARAIVRKSPIVLLDEATASLDIENELLVKEAINQLLTAEKTVVMIAHTLPIIKGADQIIVLAEGSVAECGTHEQLLLKNGKYAAMWQASQNMK